MYSGNQGLGWVTAVAQAAAAAWQVWEQTEGDCARGFNKPVPPDAICPGTPDYDSVSRAIQRATDAEILAILGTIKATNNGKGPNSREELLKPGCLPRYVKAMMGGGDCRCTKVPSQCDMLPNLVAKYGRAQTAAEEVPGSGIIPELASGAPGQLALAAGLAIAALFVVPALMKGR